MHDVLRDRLWRKLEALPEPQLYQVLDYIEFLESKYAPGRSAPPSALQKFAERLEDGMRIRNVAPKVISGTVGLMGTANRVIQGVQDAGRELLKGIDTATQPKPKS
ncbi:MAG TPA: DUF2281 domain-containing protein, partial [Longimicrobiales bacterium]|nr:DUF2281 domain-containing protein [Longimicrobiales bacterium]